LISKLRQLVGTHVISWDTVDRLLAVVGLAQTRGTLDRDAERYWSAAPDDAWKCNSHWRDASVFSDGSDLWSEVGRRHLELFERMARVMPRTRPVGQVLEWGCGGGANAVRFAPLGTSFVGIDISQDSLDECGKQIAEVGGPPFIGLRIDAANPEAVISKLTEPCDLFTSFYLFELVTSQEYGARLLRIARRLLSADGLAFIQIKYDTGSFRTRSRRRNYQAGINNMTTYRIDEFWSLAEECGLTPEAVYLVPKNQLDERYAYFLMSRSPSP
jgi:hypothetical protein